MMNSMNERRIRVATFLHSHWLDNAVTGALEDAGLAIDKHRSAMSLVAALHSAETDIAVVEDNGEQLAACLCALRFRGMTPVPVLAIGQGSSERIAEALRYGATDYAVVGEAMGGLVNRVLARVQFARECKRPASFEFGGCQLDAEFHCLRSDSQVVHLTSREFAIAWLLFEHGGQVVNINTLSSQVWGRDAGVAKRTIEQHMSRLRAKLREVQLDESFLKVQAVNNVGYRLARSSVDTARRRLSLASPRELPGTWEMRRGHVVDGWSEGMAAGGPVF